MALPEINVQMQLPNTLPYMTEVMTCTFSLRLQTVLHTYTFTGLRLKTPMRIPAEEGQLHLGFVHSLIKGQAENRNVQITQTGERQNRHWVLQLLEGP